MKGLLLANNSQAKNTSCSEAALNEFHFRLKQRKVFHWLSAAKLEP